MDNWTQDNTVTRINRKSVARWYRASLAVGGSSIQRRIEYWKVVEPKQAKFLELQLASHAGGGYDLEYLRLDSVATIAEYAERGIEYFVVRPETMVESRKAEIGSPRLLRELRSDPGVKLIKRFESDEQKRPGPTIEIYRLVDPNKGPGPVVTGSSFRP